MKSNDNSLHSLKVSSKIAQKQIHGLDTLLNIVGNKPAKVAMCLVRKTTKHNGLYFINQSKIAQRLHISDYTVTKAMKMINKLPNTSFKGHWIRLNVNKKGDVDNE